MLFPDSRHGFCLPDIDLPPKLQKESADSPKLARPILDCQLERDSNVFPEKGKTSITDA